MATTEKRTAKPKGDGDAKRTAKLKGDGDAKRTELKSKVEAAQKRNEKRGADRSLGDYAREAGTGATSFVKEHPITTVVGGLALGVLIASFVPGPGKRLRKKASARSAVLAGALADLAVTYGSQLLEGAEKAASTGRERLGDLGGALGDAARSTGREAGSAAETAGDTAREIGKAAVRTLRDLRSRVTH